MSDQILLELIDELKEEIKVKDRMLSKSFSTPALLTKHIGQPIRKAWEWWWDINCDRGGVTIALGAISIVAFLAFWALSGFPTSNFYVEQGTGNRSLGVYQEYNWGSDPRVIRCDDNNMNVCVANMKKRKQAWNDYQAELKQ